MKPLRSACLLFLAVFFAACNSTPSPTAPATPNGPPVVFSIADYGESIDSTFFKVWSDSSWDEFYMDTTVNGTRYTILLDNYGNESIYGPGGYSGFGSYGGSIILFDSALAAVPDSLEEGTPYVSQTTFSYQGGQYVLTNYLTLVDTGTVSVPFGTFTDCRLLQSIDVINGVLQNAMVYGLAKGPSDILRQYNSAYGTYSILMAYGVVNGERWGVSGSGALKKALPPLRKEGGTLPRRAPQTAQGVKDIRSLAPIILKGMSLAH
jgi:hypothetical protein